ncbi:MAG TPA: class I adenylate-forming enzyme family protein [Symbiobacteriaceae bacterium]
MRVSGGLWRHAEAHPAQPALVVGDQRWSYRDLQATVVNMGATLHRCGLRHGDRVMICLPNSGAYLIAFMAAARYGWVAVTIPEAAAEAELTALLGRTRPAAVVAEAGWAEARRASLGQVAHVLTPGAGWEPGAGGEAEPPLAGPGDPFFIGYTSGSTGTPKGVVRRHAAWVETFAAATAAFSLNPGDRFLVPGPLHFSASLFAAVHTLEIGGTLFLERRFNPRRVLALMADQAITGAFMVPTLYQSLVEEAVHPLVEEALQTLPEVRCLISCGEKLRPAVRAALETRFSAARVFEYYGSSEVGFMTLLPPEWAHEPDSVGLPFPGVDLIVRRSDGAEAAPGEVGILHARSPMAAAGYGDGTELTPIAGADGWIRTGDLARVSAGGLIYLEGRADDAINAGGATVFPADVESVLAAHPGVAEVAVVGRPHPQRGEEMVATVVLRPGATVSKAELRAHCAARLAPFKRPRTVIFLAELPRTESGKVSRKLLREQLGQK